jgi:hypothetical protein
MSTSGGSLFDDRSSSVCRGRDDAFKKKSARFLLAARGIIIRIMTAYGFAIAFFFVVLWAEEIATGAVGRSGGNFDRRIVMGLPQS